MQIYLTRHGQSCWQVNRNSTDWDSPLTELGHRQAGHLGHWLANGSDIKLTHLRASNFQRAQQTAGHIADALKLPLVMDEKLREADFLVSDHLARREEPHQPLPPFSPSEQYAALKNRAYEALENLIAAAENQGGPVLGVAHGGLISTLLRLVTGSDSISFWIYNATLHLIEWKRGRWHLIYLNRWDHLPPELRTF